MDKKTADKIIIEYTKKLFGYALSKTSSIEKAEELASKITLEVYISLLKRDCIINVGGYIYRIAQNVFANFIDEAKRGAHLAFDEMEIPADDDFTEELIQSETYKLLRREITYLSRIQREIVIMHYYDRLKIDAISKKTGIPPGTVKWHLYDSKNSMKEGLNLMRNAGTLGIKPVKLCYMGHSGSPGSMGDTSDFLKKRLTQNIAYAAYHDAKTINEIAEELGVSPLFVEDEVAVLEEYGFMDKLPGGKYLTNIYIDEPTAELCEKEHLIFNKYAQIVCDKYVPSVIGALRNYDRNEIYVPDDDSNLLLWSSITYACGFKLEDDKGMNSDAFTVKRKDGGDYIACATVETDFKLSYNTSLYSVCGNMDRGSQKYPLNSWQLNTYYDGREGGWRENLYTDYEYLYEFITGALKKEESQIDKFKRLYDKSYLIDADGNDKVNIVVIKNIGNRWHTDSDFTKNLPAITDELKVIGDKFDDEMYELRKDSYPPHMQKLCRAWTTNCLSDNNVRPRVLEKLLLSGILTLPSETQKHGLTTIMFCDVLPK